MTQNLRCTSCERSQPGREWCTRCGALLSGAGYRVVGTLSQTPVGRVYRAVSPKGADVALKEIAFATAPDTRTIDRFEREGKLLKQLSHPQIPAFAGYFQLTRDTDTRLYLAQRYIHGQDLEKRFEEHRFDETEAWVIAAQVLGILNYLHTCSPQILHRDIKPSNIVRAKNGRYHLVDFGAARDLRLTIQSSIAGTPGYMSPEQMFGRAEARSDLYSLGMTLARLLSRREPSELITPDNRGVMIAPYVNASDGFIAFLGRLLHHDPGKRFPTARAAGEALQKIRPAERDQAETLIHKPRPTGVLKIPREVLSTPPKSVGPRDSVPTAILSAAAANFRWVVSKRGMSGSPYGARAWGIDFGKHILGLRPGHEYLIGRGEDCDVPIPLEWPRSNSVSRHHVSLTPMPSGLLVRDLGSANGTSVGMLVVDQKSKGLTITQPTELKVGAIRFAIAPLGPAEG